jgi:hypothetical protein
MKLLKHMNEPFQSNDKIVMIGCAIAAVAYGLMGLLGWA